MNRDVNIISLDKISERHALYYSIKHENNFILMTPSCHMEIQNVSIKNIHFPPRKSDFMTQFFPGDKNLIIVLVMNM